MAAPTGLEGMGAVNDQINLLANAFFFLIVKIAFPCALLRLGISGIRAILGPKEMAKEEIMQGVRQIALGLCVIGLAPTILWIIKLLVTAFAVKPVGW